MTTAESAVAALLETLLSLRNADGGWPYYAGKASRLESTCWAALALLGHPEHRQATETLLGWPRPDGLFVEGPSGQVNYAFNGLAAVALSVAGPGAQAASDSILKALMPVTGLKGRNFKELGQDNSLQGWPWVDQSASWVEPTSWCLLALKRRRDALASAALQARLDEAEKFLLDRACRRGGWNYGSPLIFDKSLPPQVPTTAVAVLAMQDRLTHPVLVKAVDFLDTNQVSERSTTALSLASIGGRVCGRDVGAVTEALLARLETTREMGACTATAVAICALRGDPGVAPFRL